MDMTAGARAATPAPFPVCRPEDRGWILATAILASALGFIDGSVVAIAMPAMREGLGASLAQAQWIGAGYLLALSSLVLTGGAMGDRFGVARVFGLGILVFVAASMVCAIAPSPGTMIAARVLQGLGAGLMVPGSMSIIARAYPAETRGRALGLWAAAASATTAAGPILGGLVLTWGPDGAWRLIFAINLPFGGLALWILATKALPDPGRAGTPVDLAGASLACTALALAAWGLTEFVWAAALGGGALFATFLVFEARSRAPMIRLGLFRNRGFASANLATLFLYFALAAVLFYLPMTAVTAWGASEIAVTGALLPLGLLIGLISPAAGRLTDRFGPGPMMAGGMTLVALAAAGLALVAPFADIWRHILPLMVLLGVGMGLVVAPLSVGVMAAAGEAVQGAASGIYNAVARVANLLAVALMGGVAAWAYARVGGPSSFAAPGAAGEAHRAATAAGFAAVATAAAAASAIAAVIAARGVRRQAGARR
jgi:EmrB/QacA subfamily drug resistance transporter